MEPPPNAVDSFATGFLASANDVITIPAINAADGSG
jgi:hypothetical protein